MDQGGLNGAEGVSAGEDIGDEDAGRSRILLLGLIAEVCRVVAAGGVNDRRIGGTGGARARLPVAGDRAIDQFGIVLAERGVVEAQPRHHAGPEVLDHDVGQGGKLIDDRLGGLALQVDRKALLAAVERAEIAAVAVAQRWPAADHVALEPLDLDDLGTEVGHQARAVRAGQHRGEIEHADALQRTRPRFGRRRGRGHRRTP